MLLGSVSSQQRFGVTDIKALGASLGSWTNCVTALRQISATALFYLEDSRRIHPQSVRACQPKDAKRRVEERASVWGRERALWLLFLYVFPSPWACPMQTGLARSAVGEGDGTPLQYSCLENPMDGGAWWAAVHGVAKSRT